jgi:hypothetical protein
MTFRLENYGLDYRRAKSFQEVDFDDFYSEQVRRPTNCEYALYNNDHLAALIRVCNFC